jgi:large subunit ribosomal protein L24
MQTTKPGKQRKMLYQAPLHVRRKHFSARLSPELKASRGANALPVRSGDKVRVMRGDHRGFEGKVTRVDSKKYRVFIEGLTREKVDGTTVFVSVHPSKVMITNLSLDDKWRKKILERKIGGKELEKAKAEKPPKEVIIEKPITPIEKPSEKKTKPKREQKTEEKPKLKRKKALKKPAKKKGKKEVKMEENIETTGENQEPTAKKKRGKPKSSRRATTSGRAKKSRTAGRGK